MVERYGVFTQRIARISRCIRRLKAEEMARFGLKGPHVSYQNRCKTLLDGGRRRVKKFMEFF